MNYVVFAVEAALISNIALSYFLGLSPFPEIGKNKKQTCVGALAMVIVMTLSSLIIFKRVLLLISFMSCPCLKLYELLPV